jgi:hypothetical protein
MRDHRHGWTPDATEAQKDYINPIAASRSAVQYQI